MIVQGTSVYRTNDLENLARYIKWERIEDKIGTFNSTAFNNSGVMKIWYTRELRLIRVAGYGSSTSVKSSTQKIFNFNNDLPGDNDHRLFEGDVISLISSSNGLYSNAIVSVRPYVFTDPSQSNAVSVRKDNQTNSFDKVSCIDLIADVNLDLYDAFNAYLDSH